MRERAGIITRKAGKGNQIWTLTKTQKVTSCSYEVKSWPHPGQWQNFHWLEWDQSTISFLEQRYCAIGLSNFWALGAATSPPPTTSLCSQSSHYVFSHYLMQMCVPTALYATLLHHAPRYTPCCTAPSPPPLHHSALPLPRNPDMPLQHCTTCSSNSGCIHLLHHMPRQPNSPVATLLHCTTETHPRLLTSLLLKAALYCTSQTPGAGAERWSLRSMEPPASMAEGSAVQWGDWQPGGSSGTTTEPLPGCVLPAGHQLASPAIQHD